MTLARGGDKSCQVVFVPWIIRKQIKCDGLQTVSLDVQNLDAQEKSDHVCLDMNMGKILAFKKLRSNKRYSCFFGSHNW